MSEILYTNINGLKICYDIKGEGYPIFLVHGFIKKEFWIGQIDELSKEFKVIWYDNRGMGKSDRSDKQYTMEKFADDLKGLMDSLEIKKAHFVGHSMGSYILLNFSLKYPNCINKLVLMSVVASWPQDKSGLEMYKKSQIALYEAKMKNPEIAFYNKMKIRFTRNFLKSMEADPKKKFHGIFSSEDLMHIENIDPMTPTDIINYANAIGGHDTLDRLHEIKNKTLIIYGRKDKLGPKLEADKINERIPNSDLNMVSGSHWFPLENAPEINQIILDFLKN
jgi:pimeloyl-ACP methyl ester carboxylesterase